jgi:hypothetical protein
MALYDRTVTISAPQEAAWKSVSLSCRTGRILYEDPGHVLITQGSGFVAITRLEGLGSSMTSLRRVVDTVARVMEKTANNWQNPGLCDQISSPYMVDEPGLVDRMVKFLFGLFQTEDRTIKWIAENAENLNKEASYPPSDISITETQTFIPKPKPPGNLPWNPKGWVYSLSWLFSFGVGGIITGLNWHRMGKPKLGWGTIFLSVVGFAGWLAILDLLPANNRFGIALVNPIIGYLLYRWQKPAYESWMAAYDTSQVKKPGWIIPIGIGVGSIAVIFSVIIGFALVQQNDIQQRFSSGVSYLQQGDYAKAIAVYDGIIKIQPDMAGAYHNRGLAYFKLGNYSQAQRDLTQAIQKDPTQAALSYRVRGATYIATEDYVSALADFNRSIQLDPKSAEAVFLRGLVYVQTGMKEEARADFEQVLKMDGTAEIKQAASNELLNLGE